MTAFHLTSKRFGTMALAGILALSTAMPAFSEFAAAAPLTPPASAVRQTGDAADGLPMQEVRYKRRSSGVAGAAIGLGLLGLGAAAIASQQRRDRYRDGNEDRGFYDNRRYPEQGYYNRRNPNGYTPAPGFYGDRYNGY